MRRPIWTPRQVYAIGLPTLLVALWGCSGRQVNYDLSEDERVLIENARRNRVGAGGSNVTVRDKVTFGLTSEPASVTRLSSLLTSVNTSVGATYRYSLIHGDEETCSQWSEFISGGEPLKLSLGADGPKTLCIQQKGQSGQLSEITVHKFVKESVSTSGPQYTLSGQPTAFTSQSSAQIRIDSGEAYEFRYRVLNSAECGTLENSPWTSVSEAIESEFRFDGVWSLCLQVRDVQGNATPQVAKYSWTRDTVNPVLDDLNIPEGPLQQDELEITVKGTQVYEYQFALIDSVSDCKDANYGEFISATEPLKVSLAGSGLKTLCILSRSEAGLMQQAPFVRVLQKLNLQALVKALPVAQGASATTPKQFSVSGEAVTHYKALSFDFSTTCDGRAIPGTAAQPVAKKLDLTFSNNNIKTLCVWGISQSGSSPEVIQNNPTYFRFYNDNKDYSYVYEENLVPYSFKEAANACARCHTSFVTTGGFQNNSVNISLRLRDQNAPRPMPPSGWSEDENRKRMMLFLYSLPGFPQDLPQQK
ncbi:MAG: hypothetical protein RJB13_1595 [Pseudomonadota bacterium]